jgi:hypothetical protein
MATNDTNKNGGNLGFEAEMFKAADPIKSRAVTYRAWINLMPESRHC